MIPIVELARHYVPQLFWYPHFTMTVVSIVGVCAGLFLLTRGRQFVFLGATATTMLLPVLFFC